MTSKWLGNNLDEGVPCYFFVSLIFHMLIASPLVACVFEVPTYKKTDQKYHGRMNINMPRIVLVAQNYVLLTMCCLNSSGCFCMQSWLFVGSPWVIFYGLGGRCCTLRGHHWLGCGAAQQLGHRDQRISKTSPMVHCSAQVWWTEGLMMNGRLNTIRYNNYMNDHEWCCHKN